MRQINNLILSFILIICSANSDARDITLSPQALGEQLLHETSPSRPPAALKHEASQHQKGIDYDGCTSPDSRHIHAVTYRIDGQSCLILAQDRHNGKITGVALSGPLIATPHFRHIINTLTELVSSASPPTALQKFHFHTFLVLHEWYNSSTPVSINGLNFSYYSDGQRRIFTLTSHDKK